MNKIPDEIDVILASLESAGYEAYAVGGCVRDMLLGRQINDWDIATDAHCSQVERIFPKTLPTGIKHGTVTVFSGSESAQVTTFRSDGVYKDGRRPENVTFVSALSEDLKRRDFTMNALAMDRRGTITDIFGGMGDIKKELIRCVGAPEERFSEDALRMLRALRFSAELGFSIEEKTLTAIKKLASSMICLSAERIRDECEKMLMSERPQCLAEAVSMGLLNAFLINSEPDKEVLSRISLLPRDKSTCWAALTAALLKCGAVSDAWEFLRSLRLDRQTVSRSGAAAEIAVTGFPKSRADIKRLFSKHDVPTVVKASAAAKALGDLSSDKRLRDVLNSGECISFDTLAVSGRDLQSLGMPEGAEMGLLLRELLEHVFNHPEDNHRRRLLEIAESKRKQIQ